MPILAMTAYPMIAGIKVKSMMMPRSFRRSETMAMTTVRTEATAYGITDQSWASFAV